MRVILLVDMDAFFASVEQQANPALRGKPVGVIGSGKRTVITTASYEARSCGVKTGMNLYEARQVCPELIVVVGDNDKYTHTCRQLKEIYKRFTPLVEVYSVDEAFLDITGSYHLFGSPIEVGKRIKYLIKQSFGINATVGIGPNKLVAKLAADISKPDGLRWIKKEEIPDILEDLPVEQLWGIGRKTAERLRSLGIKTCGQLGRASSGMLRSRFGVLGEHLKAMAQGVDHSPVLPESEDFGDTKSIGHSMTLPRDIYTRTEIDRYLMLLAEMVASRARRYGYEGRVITVIIRYRSFETFSLRKRLSIPTDDTHLIFRTARDIVRSVRLREPVRLIGVSISGLTQGNNQIPLFEEQKRRKRLLNTLDEINTRFGSNTLLWAAALKSDREPGVISPAWRPDGVRRTL